MLTRLVALSSIALIVVLFSETTTAAPRAGAPVKNLMWSFGAPNPQPPQEAAIAEVDNKRYVISGSDQSCSDTGSAIATTAVDIYDTVQDTFTPGPNVNLARTEQPLAATIGHDVFLIGGTPSCGGPTVRPVEMLDLSSKTWTVLPATSDLPLTLDGAFHCGAAHANQIYYYVQSTGIGVFDTATNTWTVLAPSPLLIPSSFCRATTVGDPIVITGPGDGSDDAFSQRILVFDIDTGEVSLLSATTVPLAEPTAGRLRGRVVVTGGDFGAPAEMSVQAICHDAVATLTPLPVPSDDAVGGVIGDRYFILGGHSGSNDTPPVLIGTP